MKAAKWKCFYSLFKLSSCKLFISRTISNRILKAFPGSVLFIWPPSYCSFASVLFSLLAK